MSGIDLHEFQMHKISWMSGSISLIAGAVRVQKLERVFECEHVCMTHCKLVNLGKVPNID